MWSAENMGKRTWVSHDRYGFTSDWLREWHKMFQPITKRSNAKSTKLTKLDLIVSASEVKMLTDEQSFRNILLRRALGSLLFRASFFGLATVPVLLTKWDDSVSSPNYPLTYPANITLTWIKTVSSGNRITITIIDFQVRNSENLSQTAPPRSKYRAIPHPFERLFLISWENNRDCHITMPLSLKTMEVQIKGDQWNKRFRTV